MSIDGGEWLVIVGSLLWGGFWVRIASQGTAGMRKAGMEDHAIGIAAIAAMGGVIAGIGIGLVAAP